MSKVSYFQNIIYFGQCQLQLYIAIVECTRSIETIKGRCKMIINFYFDRFTHQCASILIFNFYIYKNTHRYKIIKLAMNNKGTAAATNKHQVSLDQNASLAADISMLNKSQLGGGTAQQNPIGNKRDRINSQFNSTVNQSKENIDVLQSPSLHHDEVPLSYSFENNLNHILHQNNQKMMEQSQANYGPANNNNKTIFDVKEIESKSSQGSLLDNDEDYQHLDTMKPENENDIKLHGQIQQVATGLEVKSEQNKALNEYDQDRSPHIKIQFMDSQAAENLSSDEDQNLSMVSKPRAQQNSKKIREQYKNHLTNSQSKNADKSPSQLSQNGKSLSKSFDDPSTRVNLAKDNQLSIDNNNQISDQQQLKSFQDSPQLTANFNGDDMMIQTPQFKKTDTAGPYMNANRQKKSPIMFPDNTDLYKFNSQNPYKDKNSRATAKFGNDVIHEEHKDSSLYDSSSGSGQKSQDRRAEDSSRQLDHGGKTKSPNKTHTSSYEPKSILKKSQDNINLNELKQGQYRNILSNGEQQNQSAIIEVKNVSTTQDLEELDVGDEWCGDDSKKGLHMPRLTGRYKALCAFDILSRFNEFHMREPMMSTLRNDIQNIEKQNQSSVLSQRVRYEPSQNESQIQKCDDQPHQCMSIEQQASIREFRKLIQKQIDKDDEVIINDHLEIHRNKYQEARQRIQNEMSNPGIQIETIEEMMENEPIKCFKFNYSLDDAIQKYSSFRSILSISDDGEGININNLRPNDEKNKDEFILEADHHQVNEQRYLHQIERSKVKKRLKQETKSLNQTVSTKSAKFGIDLKRRNTGTFERSMSISQIHLNMKPDDPQSIEIQSSENDKSSEWEDPTEYWRVAQHLGQTIKMKDKKFHSHLESIQNQFKTKISDASCKIEDITGIIYGGISSRFWLYRKNIICQDFQLNLFIEGTDMKVDKNYKPQSKAEKVPFYSWECITLEVNNGRTLDLVIKDEDDMMKFIKYLIWRLETINNHIKSGVKLKEALIKQNKKENQNNLSESAIVKDSQYKLIRKTYLKYLILRIRAKISYMAFIKRQTIVEMIVSQCYKSYKVLSEDNCIPKTQHHSKQLHKKYDSIFKGDMKNMFHHIFDLNIMIREEEAARQIRNQLRNNQDDKNCESSLVDIMTKIQNESLDRSKIRKICDDSNRDRITIAKIMAHVEKQTCIDMFQNVQVNDIDMYQQKNKQQVHRYKIRRTFLMKQYMKIRLILALRMLKGLFFIETLLTKIKLAKQIFVLDVEQGQEVFILDDLSQRFLPLSYKYYDPIIKIIFSKMSSDSKSYFTQQTSNKLTKMKEDSMLAWIKDYFVKTALQSDKMSYKFSQVNVPHESEKRENVYFDPEKTKFTKGLQRSQYIYVEENLARLKELAKFDVLKKVDNHPVQGSQSKSQTKEQLNNFYVSFQHEKEVEQKREMFLIWQKTFLQKHEHIKDIGQRLITIKKLENFIEENLDYLYENRNHNVIHLLIDGIVGSNDLKKQSNTQDFAFLNQFNQQSKSISFDRTPYQLYQDQLRINNKTKIGKSLINLNLQFGNDESSSTPTPGAQSLDKIKELKEKQDKIAPNPVSYIKKLSQSQKEGSSPEQKSQSVDVHRMQRKLLNRKTTYGAMFNPFKIQVQNQLEDGTQKSLAKLELEEYKNKMRYKEFLLDLVEKKVKLRRANQRQKKIAALKTDDQNQPFEVKKQRVEKKIEELSSYFTNESNLRNPSRELKVICKQLIKIQDRLGNQKSGRGSTKKSRARVSQSEDHQRFKAKR